MDGGTGLPALFQSDEIQVRLDEAGDGLHDLPYEDVEAVGATEDHPYRRLIEHLRTVYRRDDLTGPLAFGRLESLALPHESYKLAFTPGLASQVYGTRVTDEMLASEGRYNHLDGDTNWWVPSGRLFFSLPSDDTAAQELAVARAHFFLPRRLRDPFGESAAVDYDSHDLLRGCQPRRSWQHDGRRIRLSTPAAQARHRRERQPRRSGIRHARDGRGHGGDGKGFRKQG